VGSFRQDEIETEPNIHDDKTEFIIASMLQGGIKILLVRVLKKMTNTKNVVCIPQKELLQNQ
jgi:hypothetical protein